MKHNSTPILRTCLPASLLTLSLLGCGISSNSIANSNDTGKLVKKNNAVSLSESQPVETMNKEKQIKLSKIHLAAELEVDPNDIKLAGIESVTWRSGAMGCPKPGMMYTQALVPGVLIMLTVDGTAYRYHAAPMGEPFYCPSNRAESPSPNSDDI